MISKNLCGYHSIMSYPRSWSYLALNRLPISQQRVKVLPSTPTQAAPGDTIAWQLPSNTMVDLRSIALNGTLTTTGTGGTSAIPFVEALIESLAVEINGQVISSGHAFYSQIWKLSADMLLTDRVSLRKILQLQQDPSGAPATAAQTGVPFSIVQFLGFLGTSTCSVIDTSILGNVRILLRLSSAAVLANSAGVTATTYSLANLNATMNVIDVLDGGVYGQLLQRRLAESPLQISWSDYVAVQGSVGGLSQTTRFSVATQSLDALHATVLPSDYATVAASSADANCGSSHYFSRGTVPLGGTVAGSGSSIASMHFTLNAQLYPGFGPATIPEAFTQSLMAWSETQTTLGFCHPKLTSLDAYVGNLFFHSVRFNALPSVGEQAIISGINTVGNTVLSSWTTTQGSGTNNGQQVMPLLFLEHTRTMNISAGRQLSVIA